MILELSRQPVTPMLLNPVNTYELSSCGGYWLTVEGLRASGNLVPGMPRYSHEPKMSPVLVGHVIAYLKGAASLESLVAASEEDPELEALRRNSRGHLILLHNKRGVSYQQRYCETY